MLVLDADARARMLERMADGRLDVLVVGGGITGAGVALDAVSRGLRVGLVEREDFASGTSGRSSRLIHGGIRYLRYGRVGIVRESLRERDLLFLLAPHLVRPMPFLAPVRGPLRAAMKTGMAAYDLLAGRSEVPGHRWVGEEEGERLAPALAWRPTGYVTWDGRTDDARLTLEVVRQAALRGALVANHAEVVGLPGEDRVDGAEVRDLRAGSSLEVRADVVVNAAGAWADRILGLATPRPPHLRPSKGAHVVLDRARVPINAALLLPSLAELGAFILVIPWGPRVYVGTTDTPYEGAPEAATVDPEDVEVLLGSLGRAVKADPSPEDVLASWAGVRPLLDRPGRVTRDLSRNHLVREGPPGLVTVTGGKLTTYRAMAEETVDLVCRVLGRGGPSRTREIGLGLSAPLERSLARAAEAVGREGLDPTLGRRLVALYGDDWTAALEALHEDSSLAEPLVPGLPVRGVEAHLARVREMALTDEDVLERRTRLTTIDARAAAGVRLP